MNYKNNSIWNDYQIPNTCQNLTQDITTDVLIIGGGITGLSTAYHLLNQGLKVTLVEKSRVGSGVTSRTTGKLTYLQSDIYSRLTLYSGLNTAKKYYESQQYAISLVKDIINKEQISCDLEPTKSYLFTNNDVPKLEREIATLKKLKVPFKETTALPTHQKVLKSIYVNDTYVFHPLKYLSALKQICESKGTIIYENTRILKIKRKKDQFQCFTNTNQITAKFVLIATHYPYFLKPFYFPLKTKIEKSYITAHPVTKNHLFNAITITNPTRSIRYHSSNNQNYQIYLTNSHNTAIKQNDKKHFEELIISASVSPTHVWSNKDIITNDHLPFIGPINKDKNLFIASGYNTWGMTNGSLAGKIIADYILKRPNKYMRLFHPKRGLNLGVLLNTPIILIGTVISLLKTKINKNKKWYPSTVRFEKRNGISVAIYTDENQKEHIVRNLCPHLKCSLLFNEVERTWDCPCHGSRFDIDGKVIEGPSNYDISYHD